jgi:hypothetical protein
MQYSEACYAKRSSFNLNLENTLLKILKVDNKKLWNIFMKIYAKVVPLVYENIYKDQRKREKS